MHQPSTGRFQHVPPRHQSSFRATRGCVWLLSCFLGAQTFTVPCLADSWLVLVGSYAKPEEPGIHVFDLDAQTGKLAAISNIGGVANPSFLAVHPGGKLLYSTSEMEGAEGGAVAGFSLNTTSGALSLLNQMPTGGNGTCHLMVSPTGNHVLAADYSSGTAATFHINSVGTLQTRTAFVKHEGKSVNADRQGEPHAHSINLDPTGKWAIVADLGVDKLFVYDFNNKKGELTPHDPPSVSTKPGGGPRHFCFHPSLPVAYTNLELTSEVTALAFNPQQGSFKELQTVSTLPAGDHPGNTTAEILVSPDGKHLYCSNRGHNSLAGFTIDATTGKLSPIGHFSTQGAVPRNFNITPDGKWILAANQSSNNLVVLRRDATSGKLEPTGESVEVSAPVCVKFVQRGPH